MIRGFFNCMDRELNTADLVKGYEYEKDRYVVLNDEDLAALEQPMSRSIDILDFINLSKIDPVYYQKSYYLSPEEPPRRLIACYARLWGKAARLLRPVLPSDPNNI